MKATQVLFCSAAAAPAARSIVALARRLAQELARGCPTSANPIRRAKPAHRSPRLEDPRLRFLLGSAGDEAGDHDPLVNAMQHCLGRDRPVSVLDFSGVPDEAAELPIGVVMECSSKPPSGAHPRDRGSDAQAQYWSSWKRLTGISATP